MNPLYLFFLNDAERDAVIEYLNTYADEWILKQLEQGNVNTAQSYKDVKSILKSAFSNLNEEYGKKPKPSETQIR